MTTIQSRQTIPYYEPIPATNSLGLAGFIVSLVGWFTGGILCPIGLLLSLIALTKRPRAFAVAGVILGLMGSCLGLIVAVVVASAVLGAAALAGTAWVAINDTDNIEITADMAEIQKAVMKAQGSDPVPPASLTGLGIDPEALKDPWGEPYMYVLTEESPGGKVRFDLITTGKDRTLGTPDDVSLSRLDEMWSDYFKISETSSGDTGNNVEFTVGSKTIRMEGGPDRSILLIDDGERVIECDGSRGQGTIRVRPSTRGSGDAAATMLPATAPASPATTDPATTMPATTAPAED